MLCMLSNNGKFLLIEENFRMSIQNEHIKHTIFEAKATDNTALLTSNI
jgi:hypothetical protein